MKLSRRSFASRTLSGVAGAYLLRGRRAWAFDQSPLPIRKFVVPLPGLGPAGIPVAAPIQATVNGGVEDQYTIEIAAFTQQLHPDLPASTHLLGYADVTGGKAPNHRYLGGAIAATRDRPVRLRVQNKMPSTHPLPMDTTIPGAELGANRASVHLHGGLVPWTSDGGPFAWFGADGKVGPSFLNGTGGTAEAEYYYPNTQPARLLWYHDHADGITRLNAYAGMASAYILMDAAELALVGAGLLPGLGSGQDIPLILQEKSFFDGKDPNYPVSSARAGDLWYPYTYEINGPDTGRWDYGPIVMPGADFKKPLPGVSAVPEFFGDTALVNGAPFPFLEVEPRHYRFRVLNGSQARVFNLNLFYEAQGGSGWTGEADLGRPGPVILQIGTEGGFLPRPVIFNDPPTPVTFFSDNGGNGPTSSSPTPGNAATYSLLLGSGERADVIIDFSRAPVGSRLILLNDAPAPFPGGDDRNDYHTGDDDQTEFGGAPPTNLGFGPNTQTLMEFRVSPFGTTGLAAYSAADSPSYNTLLDEALWVRGGQDARRTLPPIEALDPAKAAVVRELTLNEDFDAYGRLIQTLGTGELFGPMTRGQMPSYGRPYESAATEVVHAGDTEVWIISNMTADTHPIHFHLVNVQVLERRSIDPDLYTGSAASAFTGRVTGPDPNERGWKETVRMNPFEAVKVIMKFDLPKLPTGSPATPVSPRTGGHEYVWHCHILEHEEHDMMRPLIVKP